MEPLNDQELDELLKQWPGRPAPETLATRLRRARRGPWWKWLVTGSIRLPVPLAAALAASLLVLAFIAFRNPARNPIPQSQPAAFQPVKRLVPQIIRSSYENRN
jgi:hypothetical protein